MNKVVKNVRDTSASTLMNRHQSIILPERTVVFIKQKETISINDSKKILFYCSREANFLPIYLFLGLDNYTIDHRKLKSSSESLFHTR